MTTRKNDESKTTPEPAAGVVPPVNRRRFLQALSAAGYVVAAASPFVAARRALAAPPRYFANAPAPLEEECELIYSVCQQCHSRCGLRAKVFQGVLVKLDGNPYHPNTEWWEDRPTYATPANDPSIVRHPGRLCPRGQAGIQTLYDPLRIQGPLKRVGPRGGGRWEAITWEQAFAEIAARINELIPLADRNTTDIDPHDDHLGKIRNQLIFAPGRSTEKDFSERIWKKGFGTKNYDISHTSICEVSRHIGNELITWNPKASSKKNRYGAGRTNGWMPDLANARYAIIWGASLAEACFPMQYVARNMVRFKESGGRLIVVDPRFNNTAAKADEWLPVQPGGDLSLALCMHHWILENARFDREYLQNTTQAAANADDHTTWTDSAYLVGTFTDAEGNPFERYITAQDLGLASAPDAEEYVVVALGDATRTPVRHNTVPHGELDLGAPMTVRVGGNDIPVRTAFQVFRDGVFAHDRAQYARDSGLPLEQIERIAEEFTEPSRRRESVIGSYRGPVKHTNGTYAQAAIQHLNTMNGNYDWRGGTMLGRGGPSAATGVATLATVPGGITDGGIPIDRHGKVYDATDAGHLFTGYPAARPWGPFWHHWNYQEAIPSMADAYPYAAKVLITYWNAWPYSTPGLRNVWEETISDETKVPCFVSISPVMGEVPAWADYVLPDSTFLEKFSIPGIPWNAGGGTAIQRPVVGSFGDAETGTWAPVTAQIDLAAKNDYRPFLPGTKTILDIHLGLARALGLPGVGAGGLRDAGGAAVGDLNNAFDYFRAQLQNLSRNANVPVDQILAKGGVFFDPGTEYQNGPAGSVATHMTGSYANVIRLFFDPLARTRDSITGEYYHGTPRRTPQAFLDGTEVDDVDAAWPLRLITYKTVHHGQARTAVSPWLMSLEPHNWVEIPSPNARALGITTGDRVRISSASNPVGVVGVAKVTEHLRPGVIGVSHSYGHWELGSKGYEVTDSLGRVTRTAADRSRAAGVNTNPIMRLDTYNTNTALQDPVGGSISYFDTRVRVEKML